VVAASPTIGVDHDPNMVAEAEQEAIRAGVRGWTMHQTCDVSALPFPTGYFHSCHSERVFQHLAYPKSSQAFAEMLRVTKPGGSIAIVDTDWGTLSVDTDEPVIERRIVRFHAERFRNPYSGRQIFRAMRILGLVGISVQPLAIPLEFSGLEYLLAGTEQMAVASNIISTAEWQRWRNHLNQAVSYGTFYGHVIMVLAGGQKPG
jgi:SAM-dependent methyltransferase